MPTSKRTNKKRSEPIRESSQPPPDLVVPPGHIAVHLRTALRLFKESERSTGAADLINRLAAFSSNSADAYVTLPAILATVTVCPATSGTPSAAFVLADIAVAAGAVLISFTYTRTDGLGCLVKEITEVVLTNTTTGTGPQKLSAGAVAQLENQKIPATVPPQERWTGKQTAMGATGGAIAIGDVVTIDVTFAVKNTKWCHTCTPDPLSISTTVTVK